MPQPPPGARPVRPAVRRLAARTGRAGAVLLRVLYVGTALLGLLVTPPVVLVLVPVVTVTVVLLLAGFVRYVQEHWPSRCTLTTVAGGTAALLPFGHAVDALQAVGTALSLAVLGLLAVVSVAWAASGPAGSRAAEGDDPSLRDLLQVLPLERRDPVGFAEWIASGTASPPDEHVRDDRGLPA